jgi:hypothetical protein
MMEDQAGSSHVMKNIGTDLPYYMVYTLEDCNLSKIDITKYGGEIHGVYIEYK